MMKAATVCLLLLLGLYSALSSEAALQRKFRNAKIVNSKSKVLLEEGETLRREAGGDAIQHVQHADMTDAHFATHELQVEDHDGIQQRRWDDGGTAVILSNDNSVAQTWDDVVGRQVMREAAQKHVDESRVKKMMEKKHLEAIAAQEAVSAANKTGDGSEERAKINMTRSIEEDEKIVDARRKKIAEDNEKSVQRTREEARRVAEEEGKADAAQQKKLAAQERRRKYIAVHEKAFSCFPGRVIAEPGQIPIQDTGTPISHYTMLFWLKPTGVVQNYWPSLLHKGETNAQRAPAVFFYPGSTRLHIRSGIGNSYSSGSNTGADPEDQLSLGTWYHIAFSHERNGQFRVYINGEQRAFQDLGHRPSLNDGPLWAGDPWHPAAPAMMADVRFYSRVLAPEEIATIFKEHKHPQNLDTLPTGETVEGDQN